MKFGAEKATASAFDTDMCTARYTTDQFHKRGGLSSLWLLQFEIECPFEGVRASLRGGNGDGKGVTYCPLWDVERSQMDFICLVCRSSGTPQSALPYPHALCASYNPLLLLQLTLISRRVSCLLLMYAIQCMHRPNVELSVLHEI